MKVENKSIRQYENVSNSDHCMVNIFVRYFDFIPNRDEHFYFRPLPNDGSGIPRFGKQVYSWKEHTSTAYSKMCKAAGMQGHKTGHSGKVTCATTLYHQNFSNQLIRSSV